MKKTFIALAIITTLSIAPLHTSVHANIVSVETSDNLIYKSDDIYYIDCTELNEYFDSDNYKYLRSAEKLKNGYGYIYGVKYGTNWSYSTFAFNPRLYDFLSEEDVEMLKEYLAENRPDIGLEYVEETIWASGKITYTYALVYEGTPSLDELMETANDIKDNLNLTFSASYLEDLLGVSVVEDAIYTPGDLNQSGTPDMSDAVSLMAYATNPEAYPLSDLQLLLGDVYQQGDGIGINDAVSIQKYLTKQIDSLPESTM